VGNLWYDLAMHELDDKKLFDAVLASLESQLNVEGIKKIGSGNECYIFGADLASGPAVVKIPKDRIFSFSGDHEYIAIIPTHENERGTEVDNRIRGLIKARGRDGLEQGVAASTEEGVTISERMPGTPLSKILLATLESISQEEVLAAVLHAQIPKIGLLDKLEKAFVSNFLMQRNGVCGACY